MPFIAKYWSTDEKRMMLGGVRKSESSRFETRKDAELRLQSAIAIHAELDVPLTVSGEVIEVSGKPEIFSDGSTIGCKWGKAAH
jgi:hypothetical protein